MCWIITSLALLLILLELGMALRFGTKLQVSYALAEQQRIWLRTLSYSISIIAFPLTNLMRHIQLRLNQTMPGNTSAEQRYQSTILVSMGLVQGGSILGGVMYVLGDSYNTLNILTGMSILGVYLYRPKKYEYMSIVDALVLKREFGA